MLAGCQVLTISLPARAGQQSQPLLQWRPEGNTQRFLLYPGMGAFLSPFGSKEAPSILSRVSSPFPIQTHLGTDQLTQTGWRTEAPFPAICESAHYTLFHMASFIHVKNSHVPYTQAGLKRNLSSPSFRLTLPHFILNVFLFCSTRFT